GHRQIGNWKRKEKIKSGLFTTDYRTDFKYIVARQCIIKETDLKKCFYAETDELKILSHKYIAKYYDFRFEECVSLIFMESLPS
ncbi:hypothetical protein BgiBS90_019646, partial [Biomphalaria glabrata]